MAQKSPQARAETDHDLIVKDFKGVNTQATRTAIDEVEFAWLENVIPIGYANMRAVQPQTTFCTIGGGVTVNLMEYVNIANVDYLLCFTTAGGAYYVNLGTGTSTLLAAAATFTGTVAVAQWKNERALIVAGNGYWSWETGGGLVSLTGGPSAPSSGSTIATFGGRVWVGMNRTVQFSAPASYTDFSTANSGGSFIVTDEALHSNINQMIAANNYLYIFGDASINVISDVRVGTGTPPPTLFSNTNISAQVGSVFPASIFAYERSIMFATTYGFYGLYGSTAHKVSEHLDGIFPFIDFTQKVSGGIANIFNIICVVFLFTYNDPLTGSARPLMACFFNKKWFFVGNLTPTFTLIASAFQSGTPQLFATNGNVIYKMFSDATLANPINTKIQSALWPLGFPAKMKEAQKVGLEVTTAAVTTNFSLTLDSDFGSILSTMATSNSGQWINTSFIVGNWVNTTPAQGQWISAAFLIFQGDAEFKGRYLGYTITSTSPGFKLNGLLMQYQVSTPWATAAI